MSPPGALDRCRHAGLWRGESGEMCELLHTSAVVQKMQGAKKTHGVGDHLGPGLIPFFSPSLEDCPGAPNSRWRRASVALPVCGRACARSRPDGAGSARGYCRRSWLWLVEVGIVHVPSSICSARLNTDWPLTLWCDAIVFQFQTFSIDFS